MFFTGTGDNLMAFAYIGLAIKQQQEEAAKRNKVHEALSGPLFFGEWLGKFEPANEIGKRGRGSEEPLVKFIYEYTGLSCDILDNKMLFIHSVREGISLPAWAAEYLEKVTDHGIKYGDPVSTKDCLEALAI
jgi:hypothetical protein